MAARLHSALWSGETPAGGCLASVKSATLAKMLNGKITNKFGQVPWKVDGTTGLPWFSAIHADAAVRAVAEDLHVVYLHLGGLRMAGDGREPAAPASVLRRIASRATARLDARDQLCRQAEDRLLLITSRPPEEVSAFAASLAAEISGIADGLSGERIPRVSWGVAHVPRAADYERAVARLDAAILSAEFSAGPPAGRSRSRVSEEIGPGAQAATLPREDAGTHPRARRAVLASLRLDLSGLVATAVVELALGRRRTTARSVGRNAEGRRLFLIGEATARAVTDLLPAGYGAVIHEVKVIQPQTLEQGRGVLSVVLFLSPDGEHFLFGVAPAETDPRMAAARASLNALNRTIEPLLVADSA